MGPHQEGGSRGVRRWHGLPEKSQKGRLPQAHRPALGHQALTASSAEGSLPLLPPQRGSQAPGAGGKGVQERSGSCRGWGGTPVSKVGLGLQLNISIPE